MSFMIFLEFCLQYGKSDNLIRRLSKIIAILLLFENTCIKCTNQTENNLLDLQQKTINPNFIVTNNTSRKEFIRKRFSKYNNNINLKLKKEIHVHEPKPSKNSLPHKNVKRKLFNNYQDPNGLESTATDNTITKQYNKCKTRKIDTKDDRGVKLINLIHDLFEETLDLENVIQNFINIEDDIINIKTVPISKSELKNFKNGLEKIKSDLKNKLPVVKGEIKILQDNYDITAAKKNYYLNKNLVNDLESARIFSIITPNNIYEESYNKVVDLYLDLFYDILKGEELKNLIEIMLECENDMLLHQYTLKSVLNDFMISNNQLIDISNKFSGLKKAIDKVFEFCDINKDIAKQTVIDIENYEAYELFKKMSSEIIKFRCNVSNISINENMDLKHIYNHINELHDYNAELCLKYKDYLIKEKNVKGIQTDASYLQNAHLKDLTTLIDRFEQKISITTITTGKIAIILNINRIPYYKIEEIKGFLLSLHEIISVNKKLKCNLQSCCFIRNVNDAVHHEYKCYANLTKMVKNMLEEIDKYLKCYELFEKSFDEALLLVPNDF